MQQKMTAIIFSTLYLIYLNLISQTLMVWDSTSYEHLGQVFNNHQFLTELGKAPQREPLYMLVVALSMKIANFLHTDYHPVLRYAQILILLISQIISFIILTQLKVRRWLKNIAVFYIGVSPVLVNCALWMYSEIILIPLLLLTALSMSQALGNLHAPNTRQKNIIACLNLGASLCACVFVKGAFELIGLLCLLPFLYVAFINHRLNPKLARKALLFLLCSLIFFLTPILAYKGLNYQLNGSFAFTNRAGFALYGNTARRVAPINHQRLQASLAYAINPHFCYAHLPSNDCDFWSFIESDNIGIERMEYFQKAGIKRNSFDRLLIKDSLSKFFDNPLQYSFFLLLEPFKFLFWETTKAGQVIYPLWLERIYANKTIDGTLLVTFGILSLLSCIALIRFSSREPLAMSLAVIIICYCLAHSPFFVLHRYSIPLGPLWIIAIAFMFDRLLRIKNK